MERQHDIFAAKCVRDMGWVTHVIMAGLTAVNPVNRCPQMLLVPNAEIAKFKGAYVSF
jgi:hypothetical protein